MFLIREELGIEIETVPALNPLNQVYVFNTLLLIIIIIGLYQPLNPLNQVYVFNEYNMENEKLNMLALRLNPLNQVYVFNALRALEELELNMESCLNPLNQVYVFNPPAPTGNENESDLVKS